MPLLHITGRVLPEGAKVTPGRVGNVQWAEDANASPIKFNIQIVSSAINVECTVDSYDPEAENSLLLIRAFQFTRCLVDCLSFISGQGLTIIFDNLIEPDGTSRHFRFANDSLAALSTTFAQNDENSLAAMFAVVGREPALFLCLNDLITAIAMPGLVAVNCGRAIEGLRTLLMPDCEERSTSWQVMNHVLNLERSYTDVVIRASTHFRHGNKLAMPGETDGAILLSRSWIVMDRFIAFRKRNSMPLPLAAFPILS